MRCNRVFSLKVRSHGREKHMAVIKKYTKKDGSAAYMFNAYLGVDPKTGKPKRTTRRGFTTQKEAKLALSRLEIDINTNGFTKQSNDTFKEVYEVWFKQYSTTVKASTAGHTERMFRLHILPKFEDVKINKITKFMCQKVVNEWNDESEEYSAFHLLKMITQKMLNYAVSQDILEVNPMQYVIMPKRQAVKKEDKVQFLELSELKLFLDKAKTVLSFQDYVMFRLLAFTGMRKGEIYPLKWSDIDFKTKTVDINKTLSLVKKENIISTPKTKGSNRILGLDDKTLAELYSWKKMQKQELLKFGVRINTDDEQLVFHRKNNQLLRVNHLNGLLSGRMKTNLYPHSFRHTHASLLFESGATMKDVQTRLGHADVKTTMDIYTHVTKTAEMQAISQLSKYANF